VGRQLLLFLHLSGLVIAMNSKRRSGRSFVAVNAAAEVLEVRRVLSATGGNEAVVQVVQNAEAEADAGLQAWRQEAQASVIQQADQLYADQFGRATETPIHWWRGIALADDFLNQAVDSVSETNVQVAGVDEGDLVETDGTYIYTISGQIDDGRFEMLLGIDLFFKPRSDALSTSRSGTKEAQRARRGCHIEMRWPAGWLGLQWSTCRQENP
jgi:hypothetical protein